MKFLAAMGMKVQVKIKERMESGENEGSGVLTACMDWNGAALTLMPLCRGLDTD